jgi:hypothetical protein
MCVVALSTRACLQLPSLSAYITYARKEDAAAAIHAVDGETLDGRTLRYTGPGGQGFWAGCVQGWAVLLRAR